MFIQTPNSTLFPEIDVASKIGTEDGYEPTPFVESRSLLQLLWPLSNATSLEIRKRLTGERLFSRFSETDLNDGPRRVILTLQDNGMLLSDRLLEEKSREIPPDDLYTSYQSEPMEEEIRAVPYIPAPDLRSRYE